MLKAFFRDFFLQHGGAVILLPLISAHRLLALVVGDCMDSCHILWVTQILSYTAVSVNCALSLPHHHYFCTHTPHTHTRGSCFEYFCGFELLNPLPLNQLNHVLPGIHSGYSKKHRSCYSLYLSRLSSGLLKEGSFLLLLRTEFKAATTTHTHTHGPCLWVSLQPGPTANLATRHFTAHILFSS